MVDAVDARQPFELQCNVGPLRGLLRDDCGGTTAKPGATRLRILRFDRDTNLLWLMA